MSWRSKLNRTVAWLMLLPSVAAAANQAAARFSISPQRVVEALATAGVTATSEQVRFLSRVTATTENSDLEVVNVTRWSGNSIKVELRCRDHHSCLPFYVLLGSTESIAPGQNAKAGAQSLGAPLTLPATQALMRDGDPATLVFEDSALRITMPVICLQSGSQGQTIRVVSTDHKRFFKAQILQAGLLKAML